MIIGRHLIRDWLRQGVALAFAATALAVGVAGPATAQTTAQSSAVDAVTTGEATEAFIACGTRYFSARGRIEPSRGFGEVESGLRNACLRELIDYRTAVLPEDASRADVNKAVRNLQTQNRRQFRAAYETAAVAELKRRRSQDAGAAPANEEQPEEQVAEGAGTEGQAGPAPSAAIVPPAPRVPQARPIPLPPPRPRDLASRAATHIEAATLPGANPSTAIAGSTVVPEPQPAPAPPARPATEASPVQSTAPAASIEHQTARQPAAPQLPEPVVALPPATAPASQDVAGSSPPGPMSATIDAPSPVGPIAPSTSSAPAAAIGAPAPLPIAPAPLPIASPPPPAAAANPIASLGAGASPAIVLPAPAAQRPQDESSKPPSSDIAALPPPANSGDNTTQITRQGEPPRVRLLDSAIGQHRVCLARAVLSVPGSKTAPDVLASALKACSEQQEARIALEIDLAGSPGPDVVQRVRKTITETTRTEAMELIGLLRGTNP